MLRPSLCPVPIAPDAPELTLRHLDYKSLRQNHQERLSCLHLVTLRTITKLGLSSGVGARLRCEKKSPRPTEPHIIHVGRQSGKGNELTLFPASIPPVPGSYFHIVTQWCSCSEPSDSRTAGADALIPDTERLTAGPLVAFIVKMLWKCLRW